MRKDEVLAEAVVIDARVVHAKPTFQLDCVEHMCRQCPHEMGAVGRLRLLPVMGGSDAGVECTGWK